MHSCYHKLCTELSSQVYSFENSREEVARLLNSLIEQITPFLGCQYTPLSEAAKPTLSILCYNKCH